MKQEEALQHLREMMWAIQRYRSIALEKIGPSNIELHSMEDIWPWVFGGKCPLPALSKIIDKAEADGILEPMDYYNMMTVLERFMPEVKVIATLRDTNTIPEGPPKSEIMHGWNREDE